MLEPGFEDAYFDGSCICSVAVRAGAEQVAATLGQATQISNVSPPPEKFVALCLEQGQGWCSVMLKSGHTDYIAHLWWQSLGAACGYAPRVQVDFCTPLTLAAHLGRRLRVESIAIWGSDEERQQGGALLDKGEVQLAVLDTPVHLGLKQLKQQYDTIDSAPLPQVRFQISLAAKDPKHPSFVYRPLPFRRGDPAGREIEVEAQEVSVPQTLDGWLKERRVLHLSRLEPPWSPAWQNSLGALWSVSTE